ncbi:MAG: Spy/CpxP family protein refolding chaperone [Candidatus Latescibacterota bacterium]
MYPMKKMLVFLFVVLAAGIGAISFAQNQQQPPGMDERGEDMSGMDMQRNGMGMGTMGMMCMNNLNTYLMHADDLKLTEKQVQQLRDRRTQLMRSIVQTRAQLQTAMIDLCNTMDQPNVNMGQVRKEIQDYQNTLTNFLTQTAQAQIDARNILTPEQRQMAQRYETTGWCAMMGMEDNMMRRQGPMRDMPPDSGQQQTPPQQQTPQTPQRR